MASSSSSSPINQSRRPPQSPPSLSSSPSKPRPIHSNTANGTSQNSAAYFTTPVTYTFNSLLRRLSGDTGIARRNRSSSRGKSDRTLDHSESMPPTSHPLGRGARANGAVYTPHRTASPFQPPPLTPLVLKGYGESIAEGARLLTRQLAEEIRLLVPARLQLVEQWQLVFSLDRDGSSLNTLYARCEEYRGKRSGFVLVLSDAVGGIFGAYLSDAPHTEPSFYGNGECFLWRASILSSIPDLSSLPPPPSADTTNAQRQTTLAYHTPSKNGASAGADGYSTPDRIRFKAFPYSGVNDYMIFCQPAFLSVGGGDGHYGLWVGDSLENGVSSTCPTFGNEPLSDEGTKFEVMGVEIWYLGG